VDRRQIDGSEQPLELAVAKLVIPLELLRPVAADSIRKVQHEMLGRADHGQRPLDRGAGAPKAHLVSMGEQDRARQSHRRGGQERGAMAAHGSDARPEILPVEEGAAQKERRARPQQAVQAAGDERKRWLHHLVVDGPGDPAGELIVGVHLQAEVDFQQVSDRERRPEERPGEAAEEPPAEDQSERNTQDGGEGGAANGQQQKKHEPGKKGAVLHPQRVERQQRERKQEHRAAARPGPPDPEQRKPRRRRRAEPRERRATHGSERHKPPRQGRQQRQRRAGLVSQHIEQRDPHEQQRQGAVRAQRDPEGGAQASGPRAQAMSPTRVGHEKHIARIPPRLTRQKH
jgi:hypothetical protein